MLWLQMESIQNTYETRKLMYKLKLNFKNIYFYQ